MDAAGVAERQAAARLHERRAVPDDAHPATTSCAPARTPGPCSATCSSTLDGEVAYVVREAPYRQRLQVFDVRSRTPRLLRTLTLPDLGKIQGAALTPDGRRLLLSGTATLQVLRLGDPARPTKGPTIAQPGLGALTITPDGTRLVTVHSARDEPETVRVWDLTRRGPAPAGHRARGPAAGPHPGLLAGRHPRQPRQPLALRHGQHVPPRLRGGGLRHRDRGRRAPSLRPRAGRPAAAFRRRQGDLPGRGQQQRPAGLRALRVHRRPGQPAGQHRLARRGPDHPPPGHRGRRRRRAGHLARRRRPRPAVRHHARGDNGRLRSARSTRADRTTRRTGVTSQTSPAARTRPGRASPGAPDGVGVGSVDAGVHSMLQAFSSTTRRICSISSKCSWSQISGGDSWMTGSPRSSARQ